MRYALIIGLLLFSVGCRPPVAAREVPDGWVNKWNNDDISSVSILVQNNCAKTVKADVKCGQTEGADECKATIKLVDGTLHILSRSCPESGETVLLFDDGNFHYQYQ